jgi:hypothetical protein
MQPLTKRVPKGELCLGTVLMSGMPRNADRWGADLSQTMPPTSRCCASAGHLPPFWLSGPSKGQARQKIHTRMKTARSSISITMPQCRPQCLDHVRPYRRHTRRQLHHHSVVTRARVYIAKYERQIPTEIARRAQTSFCCTNVLLAIPWASSICSAHHERCSSSKRATQIAARTALD